MVRWRLLSRGSINCDHTRYTLMPTWIINIIICGSGSSWCHSVSPSCLQQKINMIFYPRQSFECIKGTELATFFFFTKNITKCSTASKITTSTFRCNTTQNHRSDRTDHKVENCHCNTETLTTPWNMEVQDLAVKQPSKPKAGSNI